jgi:hypothetical protein
MKILKNITTVTMAIAVLFVSSLEAKETKKTVSNFSSSSSSMVKSSGTFDGNRIYADVTNNGKILDASVSGDSALEWPKGTGVHSVYASGLWLGATVNGVKRVIGTTYTQDMGPGPYGGDPLSAVHKIYKVSKSMLDDPASHSDFQDWPVDFGAPWVDVDGDGEYTPLPSGTDHPKFLGDQVLWFVSTDEDPSSKENFGTAPMNVEIQTTMFGFDRIDAIGDMLFVIQTVINKGTDTLDNTYLGIWSDPDLGYAGDDLVGCDVGLGMAYVYNDGADSQYDNLDTGTPAAGYDFFQGPMVDCIDPDDTVECPAQGAKMFGTYHPGKKNLTMSSMAFYINSDPVYTDPDDENELYFYMQGLRKDGSAYPKEIAGDLYDQKFCFYGDPNQDHGTANPVDGNYAAAADRRFLMNVGPFTMEPGDIQEIVFGIFHAAGGDALSSVSYLTQVDQLAQSAYDNDFDLPEIPKAPTVDYAAFTDEIVITWDGIAEDYDEASFFTDPAGNATDYLFEGYNVYQVETADGSGERKVIATYDVANGVTEIKDLVFDTTYNEYITVTTHYGSDSGLARFHVVDKDALNGNSKLITNRNYYFAVTAYGHNEYGVPKTFESTPKFFSVRPEVPNKSSFGETALKPGEYFDAAHDGPGDGYVEVHVANPAKLTGDSYSVVVNDNMPDGGAYLNWTLTNTTTGEVLAENQPWFGGVNSVTGEDKGVGAANIYDGIQVQVFGPQEDLLAVEEWDHGWKENNVRRDNAVGYRPYASLGRTGYIVENRAGEAYAQPYTRDYDRFNYWEADDVEMDFSESSLAWEYYDEWVVGQVPFSLYRHNFANGQKERLYVGIWDSGLDGGWTNNGAADWDGTIYGQGNGAYEPVYGHVAFDGSSHYDPANDAQYIADDDLVTSGGCGFGVLCNAYTGSGKRMTYPYMTATLFNMYFASGTIPTAEGHTTYGSAWTTASSVVFKMSKPLSSRDTFTFDTASVMMASNDYDPDRISVWPNPYYGFNPEERDALQRKVMFSHLPEEGKATIRIFALDGTLVRTINHNDTGSQHTYWDMKNNFELPVASGMYVAHVETNRGDKILKLAVIQPEQRLDVY